MTCYGNTPLLPHLLKKRIIISLSEQIQSFINSGRITSSDIRYDCTQPRLATSSIAGKQVLKEDDFVLQHTFFHRLLIDFVKGNASYRQSFTACVSYDRCCQKLHYDIIY